MNFANIIVRISAVSIASILLIASTMASAQGNGNGNGSGNGNGKQNSPVATGNGNGNGNGNALGLLKQSSGSSGNSGSDSVTLGSSPLELNEESATPADSVDEEQSDSGTDTSTADSEVPGTKKSGVRVKNGANGNASDGIKGRIITNRDIVYTGEPLEIGLHFSQGAQLIHGGSADAYLVIFAPTAGVTEPADDDESEPPTGNNTSSAVLASGEALSDGEGTLSNAIIVPVSDQASTEITRLFEIPAVDLSGIAAGTYQLGLILTVPGGDPQSINDWYSGLLGLVDIAGLTVSAEALESDSDGDGMIDCDGDSNGLECDDAGGSTDPADTVVN